MNETVTPEFLKALAFLGPASDAELRQLAPTARVEQYPVGAVLFREGDHLPQVFIVVAGTVALEITGTDHRPRRFQTVGPGELLGWSPLLGSGPMTATARALDAVRVVVLDARAVLNLCDQDPAFGFQFMRRTAAAIAARLGATRLQLLDVYKHAIPVIPEDGDGS
jgi:CRP-like cAMP-binding protein